MRFTTTLLTFVTASALGSAVFAQDSVSKIHGLPGDAVDPRSAAEQQNDYVVDQTIVRGSWGTVFGVAPLVKTSLERNTSPTFFNAVANAQYLSRDLLADVPFLRASYSLWNAQGAGVNDDPVRNDPGAPLATSGTRGFQFCAGAAEFGTGTTSPAGTNAALNNVTGALVNFTGARPSRLYVSRVQAAVSGPAEGCPLGSTHFGSVDADGDVYFRADNFGGVTGGCGGFLPQSGNSQFRVRLAARNAALVNVISGSGSVDTGATDQLLTSSTTTYNPPANLPRSIAGRPVLLGSNFNKEYVFEGSAGVLSTTTTHRPAAVVDHRGAVGTFPGAFPFLGAGAVATCGIVGKETLGSSEGAFRIALWGIDANGAVTGSSSLKLPTTEAIPVQITDPDQPSWSTASIPGPAEFDHYHSQTAFQGGNSQVAVGSDQAGNLLVAAVVYYGLTSAAPPALDAHLGAKSNYIAVARVDPISAATQWSVAGWTQETTTPAFSDGKTIYQNGTTPIGRLTGARFGPAMSAPMIDSVGNVWFVAEIHLDGPPAIETSGLVRAVYDPATFGYRLELVLQAGIDATPSVFTDGTVLAGRNSTTSYMVRFLDLKDSDSVSSGTAWSGNVSPWAFKGQSAAGMATSDSATLGGLVVHASVLYDVNNDGQFVRSTGTGGTVGSPDEDYEVLLFLSSAADTNSNDVPDDADIVGGPFCFGDGIDPNVTTPCPCANFGSPGHGCRNSVNAAGALLAATGATANDDVVLHGSGMPATVSCIYLQGDALADAVFGDGVRCAGGALLRMRTRANVLGASAFPDSTDTITLSQRGGVVPGSGARRFYQTYYRNSAAGFCPPETFNVTNGVDVTW